MNVSPSFPRAPRPQRGVSLIIAMLMLVVIGLASAAIIRNATSADKAVMNNRLQTQASQFAQIALQYCENQLVLPPGTGQIVTPLAPAAPAAWTVKANWVGPGLIVAHTLTSAEVTGSLQPKVYPQCLLEQTTMPKVFIVTARGFSDDYAPDANNATKSGSVVWLQSTVHLS